MLQSTPLIRAKLMSILRTVPIIQEHTSLMMKFTCYYSSDHAPFGAEILILSPIQLARVCLVKQERKRTKHTYNNNTMSHMCCTNPVCLLWFHKSEIIRHKLPRPYRSALAGLLCSSYKHSCQLREAPVFTEAWGGNTPPIRESP